MGEEENLGRMEQYLLPQHILGIPVAVSVHDFGFILEPLHTALLLGEFLVVVALLFHEALDGLGRNAKRGWRRHGG